MIGERAGDDRSWKNTLFKKYILFRKGAYMPSNSMGSATKRTRTSSDITTSKKGAAPLSGAEEQTARAISAYAQ